MKIFIATFFAAFIGLVGASAAQLHLNYGSAPNDHTGEGLRTSFAKIETNFTELYARSSVIYCQTNSPIITTNVATSMLGSGFGSATLTGSTNSPRLLRILAAGSISTGSPATIASNITFNLKIGSISFLTNFNLGTIALSNNLDGASWCLDHQINTSGGTATNLSLQCVTRLNIQPNGVGVSSAGNSYVWQSSNAVNTSSNNPISITAAFATAGNGNAIVANQLTIEANQ